MSVSDTDVKALYQGNGSTTAFAIPFAFQAGDLTHIKVYVRDETDTDAITETLKTLTTHYTLNSATSPTTVTMLTAPTADQKLMIVRVSPLTQQVSYSNNSAFLATDHEKALDRLAYQIQDLNEAVGRSIKQAYTDPVAFDPTLPPSLPADKAGCGLFINDAGTGIEYGPTAATVSSAEGYAVAAAASASAASSSASAASSSASASAASAVAAAASEVAAAASEVAAAASAAAVAAGLHITGSRGTPTQVATAGAIAAGDYRRHIQFLKGNGGAATGVTMAAGTAIGDQMEIFFMDDTNTISIAYNATNVNMNGDMVGGLDDNLCLTWDGSYWNETSRRDV